MFYEAGVEAHTLWLFKAKSNLFNITSARKAQTTTVILRGVKPHRLRFEEGDQAIGDQALGLLTGVDGKDSCFSLKCNILARERLRRSRQL